MANVYLEKISGLLSAAKKLGGDLTGANVRNATKAFKTDKTKSFLELSKGLKDAVKDNVDVTGKAQRAAAGAAGGIAVAGVSQAVREKKASDNKYLEKIAGFPVGAFGKKVVAGAAVGGVTGAVVGGKDNRIKGALAGAAAGGIAGSVFGRIRQAGRMKNIVPAGSSIGSNARQLNPLTGRSI